MSQTVATIHRRYNFNVAVLIGRIMCLARPSVRPSARPSASYRLLTGKQKGLANQNTNNTCGDFRHWKVKVQGHRTSKRVQIFVRRPNLPSAPKTRSATGRTAACYVGTRHWHLFSLGTQQHFWQMKTFNGKLMWTVSACISIYRSDIRCRV